MSSIYSIENYNFDIKCTGKLYRSCAKTRYITTISYHIYYYFRCFYYTPCFFSVIIITVYFVISVLFLFFFSPTSLLNFYVCTHMTVSCTLCTQFVYTHIQPLCIHPNEKKIKYYPNLLVFYLLFYSSPWALLYM